MIHFRALQNNTFIGINDNLFLRSLWEYHDKSKVLNSINCTNLVNKQVPYQSQHESS